VDTAELASQYTQHEVREQRLHMAQQAEPQFHRQHALSFYFFYFSCQQYISQQKGWELISSSQIEGGKRSP
jgi:hypothetical protein